MSKKSEKDPKNPNETSGKLPLARLDMDKYIEEFNKEQSEKIAKLIEKISIKSTSYLENEEFRHYDRIDTNFDLNQFTGSANLEINVVAKYPQIDVTTLVQSPKINEAILKVLGEPTLK